MGYNGVHGLNTLAEVPKRRVFLHGQGNEVGGKLIFADLMDDLYRQSRGKIPADMIIACPRCGVELNVDGTKKTFRIDYLERPIRRRGPDGLFYASDALVTVEEVLTCSRPIGKTMCGLRFRIVENWISRV
jgi:uncharacterized protein YbaR (Trm112 family)